MDNTRVLDQVSVIQCNIVSLEDPIVSQVMQSLEAVDGAMISHDQVL